jgi:hypothetical protein
VYRIICVQQFGKREKGNGYVRHTVFKFPNNLAYSSKTSCSSGERLSSPCWDVGEAEKFCPSRVSDAMDAFIFPSLFFDCGVEGREVCAWGVVVQRDRQMFERGSSLMRSD